jgi:hypothetical protein
MAPVVIPFALPLVALAFHGTIQPLPPAVRAEIVNGGSWHGGCPVPPARLRLLTVSIWGFEGNVQSGQLIVNQNASAPLLRVFQRLYALRFPIRRMTLALAYNATSAQANAADESSGFDCRNAVGSPCPGASATGHWSEHAYGEAVDLNPIENPYVGCGHTRVRASLPYVKRTPLRRGMVTPAVVQAFRSIGWGWGGSWTGPVKDYMHFSATGH